MRSPINLRCPALRIQGESDIYRKFRGIFRIIAQGTNPATDRQEPMEWYVHNPAIEKQINYVLRTDPTNRVWLFLGHTGIGKSTVLGYVCDGHQTACSSEDGLLRIHVSCNPLQITTEDEWNTHFCALLEQASHILAETFAVTWTSQDLARYIQRNAGDLLCRPNLPSEATPSERLEAVRETQRRSYLLELLKFLSKGRVKRICIVIDDLESLPYTIQLIAIDDVFRAHLRLTQNAGSEPCISALIVLRPDTYAAIWTEDRMTPYVSDRIRFGNPVSLNELFQARFETAEKKLAPTIGKPEEWKRCLDVMTEVAGRLDDGYGGTLVWLANHNVRDALYRFQQVLENRKWFQRDAKREPAFKLDEFSFAVTDAGVIRALAMPVSEVYVDNNTTIIPNLLHNAAPPRTDLLVTYVGRFLCRKCREIGQSLWMPHDLTRLLDVVDELFPSGDDVSTTRELFVKTIEWMELRGLLVKLDADGAGREYSVSPRMIELWKLMERNSLLLQCWREDVYRDMSEDQDYDKPNEDLRDTERILDSLKLCNEVIGTEAEHLRIAQTRDRLPLMSETFGSNLISRQFLRGLQGTRDQFFTDDKREPDEVTTEIMRLLKELPDKVRVNEALLEPTG